MPEHQYECRKMDNSIDDPIQGHVIDIVYEIIMPIVIKSEAGDDEDCEILGVSPSSAENKLPLINITVKAEPGTQETQNSVQSLIFWEQSIASCDKWGTKPAFGDDTSDARWICRRRCAVAEEC